MVNSALAKLVRKRLSLDIDALSPSQLQTYLPSIVAAVSAEFDDNRQLLQKSAAFVSAYAEYVPNAGIVRDEQHELSADSDDPNAVLDSALPLNFGD